MLNIFFETAGIELIDWQTGVVNEDKEAVKKILDSALENLDRFRQIGGLVAPGTDAGAWAVPHGCETEQHWLSKAGITEAYLTPGTNLIQSKF